VKARPSTLGALALLFCGTLPFLLFFGAPPAADRPAPPIEAADEALPPEKEAEPDVGPTETERRVEALITLLSDEHPYYRHHAIRGLRDLGPAARPAVPHLERFIAEEKGSGRWIAMAMVMKLGGTRKYYRQLAEAAAVRQRGQSNWARGPYWDFDGIYASAILELIRIRDGSVQWRKPPRGVAEFLEAFYEDEAAGVAELSSRLLKATPDELRVWFWFLGRMLPIPAAFAPVFRKMYVNDREGVRSRLLVFLSAPDNDVTDLRESLVPFIRDQVHAAEAAWRPLLLGTLGNLGADDEDSVSLLTAGLAEGGAAADEAARSLARLGEKARPAVAELIRIADAREPGSRSDLLAALMATGDERGVSLLGRVLEDGHAEELRLIADHASGVEGVAALAPRFLQRFREVPGEDLDALLVTAVRCDPDLTRRETRQILTLGLDQTRPSSRRSALSALHRATGFAPDLASSLSRALLESQDDSMIPAVCGVVWSLARIGEGAAPLVPALLLLVGDRGLQYQVTEALVRIHPRAPGCLEAFRRYALEGRTYTARYWCVVGIGKVSKPNGKDLSILERVAGGEHDRHLKSGKAAQEILNRPEWKRLRGR